MYDSIRGLLESPVTALLSGVPFAILGAYLYDYFRSRERVSTHNIDVRGQWQLTVKKSEGKRNEDAYVEKFLITWQRDDKFRGVIISPTGTNDAEITLEVNGEFVDKYHALFQYQSKLKDVSDAGAGLIKFKQDHNNGNGCSVNFGISSNEKIDFLEFGITRKKAEK